METEMHRGKTMWRHIGGRPCASQREWPRTDSSLIPLRRNQSCENLDFGLVASRTTRKYISVVYTTESVVLGYNSSSKLIHTVPIVWTCHFLCVLSLKGFYGISSSIFITHNIATNIWHTDLTIHIAKTFSQTVTYTNIHR